MRLFAFLLGLASATSANAQDRVVTDEGTVIVTGQSLSDTSAKLADCIARRCPPKEDIEASLVHAENAFLAGEYAAARQTLRRSRDRNRRYAATLPVEVADLNRAYGRVSVFEGRPTASRLAQIEAVEALQAGLSAKDSRVLAQRMMVGDEFARMGKLRSALNIYARVAREGRRNSQFDIVGYALLRDAMVTAAAASAGLGHMDTAERKITLIENTTEPELSGARDAARLLRANLAGQRGDMLALDKALAAIRPRSSKAPVLIYAPLIELPLTKRVVVPSDDGEPEWIDYRFRVTAQGKVEDLEPLRDSGNVGGNWAKLVEQAVLARRYAPFLLPGGSDGVSKVERFSYVRDFTRITGTRIVGRVGEGHIVALDLSADAKARN